MSGMGRRTFLVGAASVSALLATKRVSAQNRLRVAAVLPGSITDKSFTESGYTGLKRAEAELGFEFAFVEKVAPPDRAEALSDFARRGYNIILGHSGEFQETVNRIARRFPNTTFLISNGTEAGRNIATVGFESKHFGYALGIIAGRMSKAGKVGFLGATRLKFITQLEAGYTEGFRKVRPDGQVLSTYTNDWDDVAKGKEAALAQIGQGADVIFPTMDNAVVGSLLAAKEKGIWSFGLHQDAFSDWPETVLQSAITDIGGALVATLRLAKAGSLKAEAYRFGIDHPDPRAGRLGTYHQAVPQKVRQEIADLVASLKSGTLKL